MLVIVLLDATGGLLLWRIDAAPVLLIASGMIGLACGGLSGVVPRLAHDAFPDAFNATSGLLYAAFALGSFTGPLLGSAFGGGKMAWFVLGSLSAFALLVLRSYCTCSPEECGDEPPSPKQSRRGILSPCTEEESQEMSNCDSPMKEKE